MNLAVVIIVGTGFLLFGLVSKRLDNTPLTAPLVFSAFGLLLGTLGERSFDLQLERGFLHLLAELTLIFVLFSDAARINLRQLRQDHNLPARLLIIGMPLTIAAGLLVGRWLMDDLLLWEAALLAAILAPTDAALGQSVVTNLEVPVRIRQTLNVESGLNDGIALPLVLVFVSLASAMHGSADIGRWLTFGALQISLGPAVGALVGYAGARLVRWATDRNWMSIGFEGISALTIALLAYALAESVHGNGFIAAFTAGVLFGNSLSRPCQFLYEFAETEGQLLTYTVFFIFGALMLPPILPRIEWSWCVYAIMSLTVVRIVPVFLALMGTGVRGATYGFLGWFGPRGLASVLFVLLILVDSDVPHRYLIEGVVVLTVALSIVLHGLTAAPVSKWYGSRVAAMGVCEETQSVSEMPLRVRPMHPKQDYA